VSQSRAGLRCLCIPPAHPVLRWLPTKLAEWVGSNLCVELGIPPKRGSLWTAAELNAIITGNIVGGPHGHLHTFGCIQWECELLNGRPKAQCYPFDIQGHCFRNKNPKVSPISDPISCPILFISQPMSYTISYPIFFTSFCFSCMIVCVWSHHTHSGVSHLMNSTSLVILI
jgi:hypothetical protein